MATSSGTRLFFRRHAGPCPSGFAAFFVDLPPPIIRIPRDRYIVDAARANRALLYDTLLAPPVDIVERPYTLDEIAIVRRYGKLIWTPLPSSRVMGAEPRSDRAPRCNR